MFEYREPVTVFSVLAVFGYPDETLALVLEIVLLTVHEHSQFHLTFLGIVYFGVTYGNGQGSSVGFMTNMRSASACGQVTERLTFLLS